MKHKKLLIAGLAIALLVGVVSAATIEWFGQVQMTATVNQAVLVDGHSYPDVIDETATVAGGESFCRHHYLESKTSVPVDLMFTKSIPELTDDEITVTYLKSTGYKKIVTTFPTNDGGLPIDVTVEDVGSWIQWTFDYFANADPSDVEAYLAYIETPDVDSKLAAMVAISYDENEPAYLVHNNDGMLSEYDVGTWLYCPNIALVHDYDSNIPVANIGWIDAATEPENGKIVVKISEAKLVEEAGATLHWAVYAGIRSGGGLPYTLSTYPANFDWISFESATILEPIEQPFTLAAGERLDFYICYSFDLLIASGTYDIYTKIEPAP